MTIAQRIRNARHGMRLSQGQLADLIGAHAQTINKLETGQIVFSRYFGQIEQVLKMPPGALTGTTYADNFVPHSSGKIAAFAAIDLPLYATTSAKGGTMMASPDPVGYVPRPASLDRIKEAYAVMVSDTAMVPRYEVGDTILIHPQLPPVAGCDVLLRRKDENDGTMILARLVDQKSDHWIVNDLRSGKFGRTRKIERREFPKAHRVFGSYNRI